MITEENQVAAANEAFYRAFESLDLGEMEKVWVNESYIQCIHPGWRAVRGWEEVMNSWQRIFQNTQEMRFVLTEARIQVWNSLAWVTVYENLSSLVDEGSASAIVLATNIFEKRPAGWLMIHHHGSTVLQLPAIPDPSTIH
jgi:hypothetical protein